jgi:hypothetical protein
VQSTEVREAPGALRGTPPCLERALRGWSFPAPIDAGTVEVVQAFEHHPTEAAFLAAHPRPAPPVLGSDFAPWDPGEATPESLRPDMRGSFARCSPGRPARVATTMILRPVTLRP